MATRKWKYYQAPSANGVKIGSMSSGAYDLNLTRACCANYAETRRNVLARTYNTNGYQVALPDPGEEMFTWISIPIGNRIKEGNLSVNVYYELTSAVEADACQMLVACGAAHVAHSLTANSPTWQEFSIDLLGTPLEDDHLIISMRTARANTITIYCVSAYQPGDAAAPDWVDLDNANCVLGDADYPKDVLGMGLLRNNVAAVRGWKTPQNNVFNHWYFVNHKTSAAYGDMGGTNDDLGHYKFAKRREITVVKLHFLAATTGANNVTLRAEITGLAGAPAEGAAQTTAVNGALSWYTITWTLHANDQGAEKECALIIDALDAVDGSTKIALPGVYLVESSPSVAITHTVPDTLNAPPGSSDTATWIDNIRTTSNHLWLYGGRQILVGDWRTNENGDDTFAADDAAVAYGDYDDDGSIVARGLLFSSKNSKRLRVKFGYKTTAGITKEKGIYIHTYDGAVIDTDPRYDSAPVVGLKTFTRKVDGADGSPRMVVEVTDLDIRAADQEEHYDEVNEPPMVYVACVTTGAAEYIEPLFVTVEEVALEESEFP